MGHHLGFALAKGVEDDCPVLEGNQPKSCGLALIV